MLSERAWVKRDLEFWHRCTVEHYDEAGVTVSLDNMEELTVAHDRVQSLELEPGDLVFIQYWEAAIGGIPAFVVSVNGELVEVEHPESIYGKRDHHTSFLRFIQFYGAVAAAAWEKGDPVFAYKAVQFRPPLFLLFPATVRAVHFEVCVEVEFGDGESALVPTTLVDKQDLSPGDFVHTCTSYLTSGSLPDERWSPCRIVERHGDQLLLQDGAGVRFEAPTNMVAVLPKGYRMIDGKFEKIPSDPAVEPPPPAVEPPISCDVHIVRTDSWQDAATDPITKNQVDELIAGDPELTWSIDGWVNLSIDDDEVNRSISILWKGQPYFSWNRNEILCPGPSDEQLAKMIEMAIALDANVLGHDGREYH